MKKSLAVLLLLLLVLGCGKSEQAGKPDAESDGNQAQPQKTATTDKQVASPAAKAPAGKVPNPSPTAKAAPAKTPAEKTAVATVKKHMTPAQLALGDPVVNSVGMLLVPIPAGTFTMGSATLITVVGSHPAEAHKVTLTKPFLLGQHEVTQEQYEKLMGKDLTTRRCL